MILSLSLELSFSRGEGAKRVRAIVGLLELDLHQAGAEGRRGGEKGGSEGANE